MWIVVIAWLYVAITMSLVEATSSQGTVLGAVITFVFYGLAPLALVMYLLGTPARRRARRAAQAAEAAEATHAERDAATLVTASSSQPDERRLPAGDPIAPERKEP